MEVALSSNNVLERGFASLIQIAHELGIKWFEFNETYEPGSLSDTRTKLETLIAEGFGITAVNLLVDWAWIADSQLPAEVEGAFEILDKSNASIFNLYVLPHTCPLDGSAESFLPLLHRLVERSQQMGRSVMIENVASPKAPLFLRSVAHLNSLVSRIEGASLGLTLDVANAMLCGEELGTGSLDEIARQVGHLHMKNFRGAQAGEQRARYWRDVRGQMVTSSGVDEGIFPVCGVFSKLLDITAPSFVTVEALEGELAIQKTVQALRDILAGVSGR